ncbi:MAG TPA: choice-of-anchor D domain-containing protein [Bryobacteraceae bacterium]|jgi:sugar lactone lactonase YvrE|nr:choice-of-anchor D domain-containing protein [Bryobacteraceae bacterium]
MRQSFTKSSASVVFSVFSGIFLCIAGAQAQTPVQVPTSQGFGQVALGSNPATSVMNFSFSGYATPGFSLAYSTDYTLQSVSCSGSGTVTCSATVSFLPALPGLRRNALLVKDVNQKLIATTLLYGTGLAPQAVLYPGVISTVAGKPGVMGIGSYVNGDGGLATQGQLFNPQGLAIDNAGNLYIADSMDQVIRKVNATNGTITTVAGRMAVPGATGDGGLATSATLNNPVAVSVDGAGNLFIADQGNNRIRKVTAASGLISTVAGTSTPGSSSNGIGDGGLATNALLNGPTDVALDGAGNLYIVDSYNGLIRKVSATTGIITTVVAGLSNPRNLDIDAAGNLYLSVAGAVEKIDSTGKVTLLAQPGNPMGVRVDSAGNVYIADQAKNQIWQVNAQTQAITVLAGNGASGYIGDNMLATSTTLNGPQGLVLDTAGNLYVADSVNSIVRRIVALGSLSFPNTLVQEISQSQTVTLANIGNQPLTFSSLNVNANFQQQSIAGASCTGSTVLQAGTSCALTLAFAPSTAGVINGTAVFTNNNLNRTGSTQSIGLTGTGVSGAAPQLSISPASLTFGPQTLNGASTPQTLTLGNTGTAALLISSIRLEGVNASDFRVSGTTCGITLSAGTSCTISIAFSPSGSGSRSAALALVDNLASSPQVSLSGTGGAPQISISTTALTFANQTVGSASNGAAITISNTGSAPLNIASMAVAGANAGDYNVASNGCGASVAAGASCSIKLTFAPKAFGLRTASLTLSSNAAGTQSLNIAGKGTALSFPLLWRSSSATWYALPPPSNVSIIQQGQSSDVPVVGDFDGDGKPDYAVWRPSNGNWYVIPSSTGQPYVHQWGAPGDIPVPGDYDGDGKTDFAVWRPSTGTWWVIPSSTGYAYAHQWGAPGHIPVPGDYDGDGKTDFAVWQPNGGLWFVIPSSTGAAYVHQWGAQGDIPVAGDYDGDGKTDFAVWRPNGGNWFIIPSSTGLAYIHQWGAQGDIPVPGDYDGDGKTDFAVWRPNGGNWFIIPSSTGFAYIHQWGLSGDTPMAMPAN